MSLFTRTILLLFATLGGLSAVLYAAATTLLLSRFSELERDLIVDHVRRVGGALRAELEQLDSGLADWSGWDDPYQYAVDHNQEFVDSNLLDETWESLRLNLFVLLNAENEVVFGTMYDLEEGKRYELSADLKALFGSALTDHKELDSRRIGLISTSDGMILIASRPIITSKKEGPIHGTLLFGRVINDGFNSRLRETTMLDVRIVPIIARSLPVATIPNPSVAGSADVLPLSDVLVRPLSDEHLQASASLRDLFGTLAARINVEMPRNLLAQGKSALNYFLAALLGSATVCGAAFLALLSTVVLSRLRTLSHAALCIADTHETDLRVPVSGNDELTHVERAFNQMLDSLSAAHHAAANANEAKSQFLANMSHEIRTPLTAILGFTENLLEPGLSESERAASIHTIRRNGEHLLGLINDILDLSRIEAGRLTIEILDCSPIQIVHEVVSTLRARCIERELTLTLRFGGPLPDRIRTDPTRLRQILINLVGNAVKFTRQGGVELIVSVADAAADDPRLVAEVTDTGIGMTPQQAERLFQPFSQADASTTRQFGGSGLGLLISRRLAQLLGGDVVLVRTEPGVGSTFRASIRTGSLRGVRFTEPAGEALLPLEERSRASAGDSPIRGCRVLLAEDGVDNQRLIAHILHKAGASVSVVDTGQAAVEAALAAERAGTPFQVVLMDMQMPVLDGYGATRQLRAAGYRRPILALTAHAMSTDRRKCLDAGCDEYASKPIDRNTLITKIAKLSRAAPAERIPSQPEPEPVAATGTHTRKAEPGDLPD